MEQQLPLPPPVEATLLKDKVIVWDEVAGNELYQKGYFGTPLSGSKLEVSLVEALFLFEKGRIKVKDEETGKELNFDDLLRKASQLEPDIRTRFVVYRELKSRGYYVKTGFKFGTHFRVYRGGKPGEAHSDYLVHAIKEGDSLTTQDLSGMTRLARAVRKELFLGIVDEEGDVTYYRLERVKP
ncbi:MAG: tRNA-intron lyase [Euryarchaeota archaeon]|nr:tRNA-intron lyase [Euryarchaeota archaeon]